MYPTLYHFFQSVFGHAPEFLRIVNTFGFFVALSIAAAYWVMNKELARKTDLGFFASQKINYLKGKPYPISDYIVNGIFAFIIGYKVIWIATKVSKSFSLQDHLATTEGSIWLGLLMLGLVTGYRLYQDFKQRLPEPIQTEATVTASHWMGGITTVALISGFLGAKLFHIFEDLGSLSWASFVDTLFSSGGWTFYGGLIAGGAGVLIYCRSKKLNIWHILDAGAPMMLISYGLGRFGCHFSGDGDWGLTNLKPKPFNALPDWAWAYKYPNNVLGGMNGSASEMVPIPGCKDDYCLELANPVWPTPLYEALAAMAIFALFWFVLRKKVFTPGNVFAMYMIAAGIERFLIEIIREHGSSLYKAFGLTFSQAQLISVVLILLGAAWLLGVNKLVFNKKKPIISDIEPN